MTNKDLQRIINGSKEYRFEGTVLVITSYNTGDTVRLDLSAMTDETFDELAHVENSYRGIMFESWHEGGYIVEINGDEIYCGNLDAVAATIDEYLDWEA